MAKKRRQETRREQIEDAQEIHFWLIVQRKIAADVINGSVKLMEDQEEAATVRRDLLMITDDLVRAVSADSWDQTWKPYQRHFIGDENRKLFFTKLQRITRQIASTLLVTGWQTEGECSPNVELDLQWDESLLPKIVAPWVVRLATLHPGVLEHYLPRFFVHASECSR